MEENSQSEKSLDISQRGDLGILFSAESGTAALRELYENRKANKSSFSLSFISKQTGASKGYLSDIFNGRRLLNPRYWEPFSDLFKLKGSSKKILELLLSIDRCKKPEEIAELQKELSRVRKAARSHIKAFPSKAQGMFFALEVFCAFGLFNNKPSRSDLRSYYGASKGVELENALRFLISTDLIAYDGKNYRLLQDHIGFLSSDAADPLSYQAYLRQAIEHARANVNDWASDRETAIFESTFLSTKASEYKNHLPLMRQQMHQMQADIESNEGDTLLLFNVQVFPLNQQKKSSKKK